MYVWGKWMDLIYLQQSLLLCKQQIWPLTLYPALQPAQVLGCCKISNICQENIKVNSLFAREKFNISFVNIHQ